MTAIELRDMLNGYIQRGYGDVYVVVREEDVEPDLDISGGFFDEDADRLILGTY